MYHISNAGNSRLSVSSISYPAGFIGDWNNETIPANSSQPVTVTFKPTSAQAYSGIISINSDKTSGTNTIVTSGTGIVQPVTYTISGYISNEYNSGISDVILNFSNSGETVTTDSSGYYTKTINSGWTGIVTPSKSGISFTPLTRSYSNINTNYNDQNYFGGHPPAFFKIWIDKNGNGMYDSGESDSKCTCSCKWCRSRCDRQPGDNSASKHQ